MKRCSHGHLLAANSDRCTVCHRLRMARYRKNYAAKTKMYLPSAPLVPYLIHFRNENTPNAYDEGTTDENMKRRGWADAALPEVARLADVSLQVIRDVLAGRRDHLRVWTIDRICCNLLGIHPTFIYGDDWLVKTRIDGEKFVEIPA